MAKFISGRQLNRLFYEEAIAPILSSEHPDLRYAAALVGPGSDVLGYDSVRSTDHDWGPRALLFLSDEDRQALGSLTDGARVCTYGPHLRIGNTITERLREALGIRNQVSTIMKPADGWIQR
jgi:hypothetical protein